MSEAAHEQHEGHADRGGQGEHQEHTGHQERGDHDHEGHDHQEHHAKMVADFRRRFWVSLALTVPILVLSPMIQGWLGLAERLSFTGDAYVQLALATGVFLYGGWPFLKGLVGELRDLRPGMMTLIGLAVAVAYFYSAAVALGLPGKVFFWELATLIDVMLLGHWIEMRSVMSASGAVEELVKLMPAEAHRLTESGETEDVPVTDLEPGDRVLVKAGEKVPADGRIVGGRTRVNQAMLTGESRPVEKGEGDDLIGGSVNGEAAVTVEVARTGRDTYLSQVVDLVREAQESRGRSQDLANRAAMWLTVIALTAGGATLAAWLLLGKEFVFSLERMVTVMVITCPHALGLAVPLVVAVSTSLAAGQGLLIRDRSAFERARELDAVVFDKTGTLTEGRFAVSDVVPLGEADESEVLRLAASVESHSEHPIGAGIVEAARGRELDLEDPKDFEAIPGKGAKATLGNREIKTVSPGYLQEQGIETDDRRVTKLAEDGKTVVYVLDGERPAGAIALADVVRDESREAVRALKEMGVDVLMITGDSEAVARSVADELGLDDFFAEVLPDEKADRIKEAKEGGRRVAMVGDGVNDAPALVAADVGIAIGAGTDVAVESADIVLVRSDPRDVVGIVRLARASYAKMVQNLIWATAYNAVAIPLAAGVLYGVGVVLPPAVGAIIMSVSTVIVAINARLLGRKKEGLRSSDS